MGIGQTRYSSLDRVSEDADGMLRRFAAALPAFQRRSGYTASQWDSPLDHWPSLGITGLRVADSREFPHGPLLRLPLLAFDRDQRDLIVGVLQKAGLGASAFYAAPINRITGIPPQIAGLDRFENAEELAGRLFTLPTHTAVGRDEVERADRALRATLST
jgi:hypothetical protein